MGYNPTATAILGFRIPLELFVIKERVKAFEHDYPDDWEYDPKTRKALWNVKKRYGKGMGDISDPYIDSWQGFKTHVYYPESGEGYLFIGICGAKASQPWKGEESMGKTDLNPEFIKSEVERLTEVLKIFGLPTDSFGLWAILD